MMLFKTDKGDRFSIKIWSGDERWLPSLHISWKWRGQYYWLLHFLRLPFGIFDKSTDNRPINAENRENK